MLLNNAQIYRLIRTSPLLFQCNRLLRILRDFQ